MGRILPPIAPSKGPKVRDEKVNEICKRQRKARHDRKRGESHSVESPPTRERVCLRNLGVVSPPNSRESYACSSRVLATTVDDYVDILNVLNLFDVLVTQGQRKERQPQ